MKFTKERCGGLLDLELDDHWIGVECNLETDASTLAYGSTTGMWGLWTREELEWTIAEKEMETVVRQMDRLEANQTILLAVDNTAVFYSLMRGRSFNAELNKKIRRIGAMAASKRIKINFVWVCSRHNQADEISQRQAPTAEILEAM